MYRLRHTGMSNACTTSRQMPASGRMYAPALFTTTCRRPRVPERKGGRKAKAHSKSRACCSFLPLTRYHLMGAGRGDHDCGEPARKSRYDHTLCVKLLIPGEVARGKKWRSTGMTSYKVDCLSRLLCGYTYHKGPRSCNKLKSF